MSDETFELHPLWNAPGWYKMHRSAARDLEISIGALGALAWFASHKPGMVLNASFVETGLRCKRDKRRALIRELVAAGYLDEIDGGRVGGKFAPTRYVVYPVRREFRTLLEAAAAIGADDESYPQDVSAGHTGDGFPVPGVTCGNTEPEQPEDMDSGATDVGFTGDGSTGAGKTELKRDLSKREIDLERETPPPPYGRNHLQARPSANDTGGPSPVTVSAAAVNPEGDPNVTVARAVLAEIVNSAPEAARPSTADKWKLVDLVAAKAKAGWSAEALRAELGGGTWHNVSSAYAVLYRRLSALADTPPARPDVRPTPAARRPTWCGRCDGVSRRTIEDDGSLGDPCPHCSPKTARNPVAALS